MELEQIQSKDNQLIKLAASLHEKKFRKQKNLCLLEGKTLIEEAISRNIIIQNIFVREGEKLDEGFKTSNAKVYSLSDELMSKAASTDSPPPLIALAETPKHKDPIIDETEASSNKMLLYCENIQDPGNLGSIIRTAFGAGVSAVYLSENSVDVYNPKVLRSSMGAVFAGPIKYIKLEEMVNNFKKYTEAKKNSYEIIGTSPHADKDFDTIQLNPLKEVLLLAGNESKGLSETSLNLCTSLVKIPLYNNIESLNVLAATSVILFNLARHPERSVRIQTQNDYALCKGVE